MLLGTLSYVFELAMHCGFMSLMFEEKLNKQIPACQSAVDQYTFHDWYKQGFEYDQFPWQRDLLPVLVPYWLRHFQGCHICRWEDSIAWWTNALQFTH